MDFPTPSYIVIALEHPIPSHQTAMMDTLKNELSSFFKEVHSYPLFFAFCSYQPKQPDIQKEGPSSILDEWDTIQMERLVQIDACYKEQLKIYQHRHSDQYPLPPMIVIFTCGSMDTDLYLFCETAKQKGSVPSDVLDQVCAKRDVLNKHGHYLPDRHYHYSLALAPFPFPDFGIRMHQYMTADCNRANCIYKDHNSDRYMSWLNHMQASINYLYRLHTWGSDLDSTTLHLSHEIHLFCITPQHTCKYIDMEEDMEDAKDPINLDAEELVTLYNMPTTCVQKVWLTGVFVIICLFGWMAPNPSTE